VIRRARDYHNYPENRMYHRTIQTQDQKKVQKDLGWHTSGESRPILLDGGRELITAALEGAAGVPDKAALDDAFKIRRDPDTGKVNLTGKDVWVGELLAWQGRSFPLRETPQMVGSQSFVSLGV
jgi:hypothetical protein